MRALSKKEFMHKVVNDIYNKKRLEKERLKGANTHSIENIIKVNEFRRKKK